MTPEPSRPHRILMVTASEMSTDARICREAETLARAGFDVRILCLRSRMPARVEGVRLIEQRYLNVPLRARSIFVAGRLLIGTLIRRADTYHAHNVPVLPGAWMAARLRRANLVYEAHELY